MPTTTIARPSPNHDERPDGARIDMLVMHYTGMQTADAAISRLCSAEARVSSHYTIDTDGTIYAHVPEDRRAWHAGVSFWAGERNVNGCSIGIEIVNPGHEFGYVEFPEPQIAAVIDLSCEIMKRHAISPARVVGHSDVAPARKEDPGELFPWDQLADFGVGLWPFARPSAALRAQGSASASRVKMGEMGAGLFTVAGSAVRDTRAATVGETDAETEHLFLRNLGAFGYGAPPEVDVPLEKVVVAFQRHWRPWQIDGLIDEESAYRLQTLLDALS